MQNTTPVTKHLSQLDVVRGMAIFAVFSYHIVQTYLGIMTLDTHASVPAKWMYLFFPFLVGNAGVALFFVLSGFVIHYSFLRTGKFSAKDFYRRRFWRIYPSYLLALLCLSIPWLDWGHKTEYLLNFVPHALLLHNFSAKRFFTINPSFWSLAVEIQLYALYPLLIWWRGKFGIGNTLKMTFLLDVGLRLAGAWYESRHPENQQNSSLSSLICFYLSPFILWFDWTLGAYLAEQYHNGKRVFGDKLPAISIPVWLGGCTLYCVFMLCNPTSWLYFPLASLLSFVLIEKYLWRRRPLHWVETRLIPLGLCSYSFYLWHHPLLQYIAKLLHKGGLPYGYFWTVFVVMPLSFFVLYGFSLCLYHSIETWSVQVAKRKIAQVA